MPTQTVYSETLEAGRHGQIADTNDKVLISRNAEAEITAGMPVQQGVADKGVIPAAAGGTVLGVAVRERSITDDKWVATEAVRIMTEGTIWVEASADVVAGDVVTAVVATGTFAPTGGLAMDTARFEDSGAAGDLVRIRIS